jgi:hypothetical protein
MPTSLIHTNTVSAGSTQPTVEEYMVQLNSLLGISGDEFNDMTVPNGRFNQILQFTGNFAAYNGLALNILLHAYDQTVFPNFMTNTLPDASAAINIPMSDEDLTFEETGHVRFEGSTGKTFTAVVDSLAIENPVLSLGSELILRGVTGDTAFRSHPNAVGNILVQLPAVQTAGLLWFDFLGRGLFSPLTISDSGVLGEIIHSGTAEPAEIQLKRLGSVSGSIEVTTVTGGLNIEAVGIGGRNRGAVSRLDGASGPWPIITDGTNYVGSAFLDKDQFTVNITDAIVGDESIVFTDGVTPKTLFQGDIVILESPGAPLATDSWVIRRAVQPVSDSNVMTNDLSNTTGQARSHDSKFNAQGYTDVGAWTIAAATFDWSITGIGSAMAVAADRSISHAGYAAGLHDGVPLKAYGISATNKMVTFKAPPIGYIHHILVVDEPKAANVVLNLDGTTGNTHVFLDGSLDWTAWGTQELMATDPYFACDVNTNRCELFEVPEASMTMLRVGVSQVKFTGPLSTGDVIHWLVPVYQ